MLQYLIVREQRRIISLSVDEDVFLAEKLVQTPASKVKVPLVYLHKATGVAFHKIGDGNPSFTIEYSIAKMENSWLPR